MAVRLGFAQVAGKKKPGSKAGQFIREETPRKGRGGSAASQVAYRVRRKNGQVKNWAAMSIFPKGIEATLCSTRVP